MDKNKKMKQATRNARKQNIKQWFKKVLSFPIRAIKWLWRLICRVCRAIWNWLKSIDIVGMVNLTLLVAIIVLFASLISDFVRCNKCDKMAANKKSNIVMTQQKTPAADERRVVKRKYSTVLPVKVDSKTNITPKIRTIGVAKPEIIRELSVPASELPQQTLSGDVIVERYPGAPVLSNGVKVNGNLYIQNMRKYTIPCDAKINGHLFIRNVSKVDFCGKFKVNGNIYVNRESSFGPLPAGTKINGQIIL
jgi:hypothetical protein